MIATGGVIAAGSNIALLARVTGNAGVPITRASLASVAWTVTALATATQLGTGTFTISTAVFDALQQQDPRWVFDTAARPGPDGLWGYNFLGVLPASLFAVGSPSGRIQADVAFTPVVGDAFRQIFVWSSQQVFG